MNLQELRATDLYDKHFDCNEPEDHYEISVNFAINRLYEALSFAKLVGLGDRIVHAQDIVNIIAELKKQLLQ